VQLKLFPLLCLIGCQPEMEVTPLASPVSVSPVDSVDFGVVEAYEKYQFEFIITNESSRTFTGLELVSSCGCTTISFERSPLMPDESRPLVVEFTVPEGVRRNSVVKLYCLEMASPLVVLSLSGETAGIVDFEFEPKSIRIASIPKMQSFDCKVRCRTDDLSLEYEAVKGSGINVEKLDRIEELTKDSGIFVVTQFFRVDVDAASFQQGARRDAFLGFIPHSDSRAHDIIEIPITFDDGPAYHFVYPSVVTIQEKAPIVFSIIMNDAFSDLSRVSSVWVNQRECSFLPKANALEIRLEHLEEAYPLKVRVALKDGLHFEQVVPVFNLSSFVH